MSMLCHAALLICICLLTAPPPLHAAEVTNLRTTFTTSQLIIEFDLAGTKGEKHSSVEVLMDIHGKRYSTPMLTISGDFGTGIPLGTGRRITWRHSRDFPEGLDKTFKCIVNAIPDSVIIREEITPAEGLKNTFYAVNRQVIAEQRTKLMWARSGSITTKPMNQTEAEQLIRKLNKERYAGYNDWRMPTREDMEGLIFFGQRAGWWTGLGHYIADYLATCGFTDIQYGNYWTATASVEDRNRFYVANTWNGVIRLLAGSNYYYLWPVRNTL